MSDLMLAWWRQNARGRRTWPTIIAAVAGFVSLAAPASGGSRASLPQRVAAASGRYLGTPYRLMPLGEGSRALGSPKPLVDERHVDCVTFVEQSLAHALARKPGDFQPILQRIRYHQGTVRFDARNHFTLADWAPSNAWVVRDVTRAVGGACVRLTRKTLESALPAAENHQPRWASRLASRGRWRSLIVSYVPRTAVRSVAARFPSVAVVAFVSPRAGMDASHVGFVLRGRHGLTLRHASSTAGRVVDRPLLPYLARRRGVLGIVVLALREEAVSSAGARRLPGRRSQPSVQLLRLSSPYHS